MRFRIKLFIDRALSRSLRQQIIVMVVFLLATMMLSYFLLSLSGCEWKQLCDRHASIPCWLLPIYLLIDTNALNTIYYEWNVSPSLLFACSITYLFGLLFFNGMLIGIITNYIENRVERHRNGLIHYVKSGHYIIMGYDEMVPSLLSEIFSEAPKGEVVLLTSVDAKTVKEKLRRSVVRNRMDQIFITYGHRMVQDCYKDIHLEAAKEIYIVGNRTLPAHDATNVETINSITAYLKDLKDAQAKPQKITCVFEDLDTYASFKTTEIFSQISKELGIAFVPYNFYSEWAKQVFLRRSYKEKSFADREPLHYPSVYGSGITPGDDKFVHLVFVGMSNFSVAFAMEAAHMLHFPNFERNPKLRTRITFIDKNADMELPQFATRNRHFFEVQSYLYADFSATTNVIESTRRSELISKRLEQTDFLDVEFEFIKGDIYANNVQQLIAHWAEDEGQYLSLFLAMLDQRNNFMVGMNLPEEVYARGIPVFIRQERADDFVTSLRKADDKKVDYYFVKDGQLEKVPRKKRYANIYPFGMDDMAFYSEKRSLRHAKLINYLYESQFLNSKIEEDTASDKLWSKAESFWRSDKLTVALQWSNLYAAYSFRCKRDSLRAMRNLDKDDASRDMDELSDIEVKHLAVVEHNRWNVEKLLMGYRKARPDEDKYKYPDKDAAKKFKENNRNELFIHHDIRPYDDLDDVRTYDIEFTRKIPWVLKMTSEQSLVLDRDMVKMDTKEAIAKNYKPAPIGLSDVKLPDTLLELTEAIAENTHEVWAQSRLDEGWTYGPERDDARLKHPDLLPYSDLPEGEKEYDRATAMNAIKLIVKLGYKIEKQ